MTKNQQFFKFCTNLLLFLYYHHEVIMLPLVRQAHYVVMNNS